MARRITLLTDFGTADGYAAAMKGVMTGIAPEAFLDDASHDVEPGDIWSAAWALGRYWRLYPAGTVHLVVVDPGVGSGRRAIAVEADGRFVVAPDNGVVSLVLREAGESRTVSLENPAYRLADVSSTFHGRDIFAPAAGHLAAGVALSALGPTVLDPVRLEWPVPRREGDRVAGEVVHVDRFGNLVTNIGREMVAGAQAVHIEGWDLGPVRQTYSDVQQGRALALVGSAGLLEISVRDGSAAEVLGVGRGVGVVVVASPPSSFSSSRGEPWQPV